MEFMQIFQGFYSKEKKNHFLIECIFLKSNEKMND
jgi:hypothetical protein